MKRLISLFLVLSMLLAVPAALANSWGLTGPLLEWIMKQKPYVDYTETLSSTKKGASIHVAQLTDRKHSFLAVAKQENDGTWAISTSTTATWQPNDMHRLVEIICSDDTFSLLDNDGSRYDFRWMEVNPNSAYSIPTFCLTGFTTVTGFSIQMDSETSAYSCVSSGTLWRTQPISLEEFNIRLLPQSEADVIRMNQVHLALASGSDFWHKELKTKSDKKLSVYSAPNTQSYRAANGKAAVNLKGGATLMAYENKWALIEYEVSASTHRIGWVQSNSAYDASVLFADVPAHLAEGSFMTDDPFVGQAHIAEAGSLSDLRLLTQANPFYAYVASTLPNGQAIYGFVPLVDFLLPEDFSPISPLESTGHDFASIISTEGYEYCLFEITQMHYGDDHKVYAVSGNYAGDIRYAEGYGPVHDAQTVTYEFADDFRAEMLDPDSDELNNIPVDNLYDWYIDAYLSGEAPKDDELPFWFVTTRIELNEDGKIRYMEYYYVPWG